MNLNGGTLLIGVKDDGTIKGIPIPHDEAARTKMIDECKRKVLDRASMKIESFFLDDDHIHIDWDELDGKVIMRIDCASADSPVFIKEFDQNKEKEFYVVRSGPRNLRLDKTSEIVKHVIHKFKA